VTADNPVTAAAAGVPDVTIFLRAAPGGRHAPVHRDGGEEQRENPEGAAEWADCHRREREERADIVIDLHDVHWPLTMGCWQRPAGNGPGPLRPPPLGRSDRVARPAGKRQRE
jgi:hypothetical protein